MDETAKKETFDPLDMNNYRMEKLPKREKAGFELWMTRLGGPLAVLAFLLIYYVFDIPYLQNINPEILTDAARKEYNNVEKVLRLIDQSALSENEKSTFLKIQKIIKDNKKAKLSKGKLSQKEFSQEMLSEEDQKNYSKFQSIAFSKSNVALLALFTAGIILWITEAVPNYLTSLILIIGIVLTRVVSEEKAYNQLGHPVMWLNILSFVLASMLVKTRVAKRFALWFIIRFGKNATFIFFSFLIINIVLSAFISATTAKAAILLPIFMVVAAVYGAVGGKNRNNFGRNIVLQNLLQINLSAEMFVTGSGANLLAAALIAGALGMQDFLYFDWIKAAFPVGLITLLIGWFIGTKIIFRLKPDEKKPQIEGGMERLKDELLKLGPVKFEEIKAMAIFISVLALWTTDSLHGISKTAVAFLGAVVALLPGIGVVKWNEVDIPWHLLMFSAGAYTLGAGLDATDLAGISVNSVFDNLGLSQQTPFWVLYLILTGCMIFSSLLFESKTMRTLIFVPIAIGTAHKFGYPVISLALPVALLIEHVYALPFNSKPAALLYVTDHYSLIDTFKFGFTMLVIGWLVIILMAMTYFKFLGITPNGLFF